MLLGSLVPSSVAIALVAVQYGKAGVRKLLHRLLIWRVGFGWWAAVVLLSTLAAVAVGLSILVGGESPDVTVVVPGAVVLFFLSIFPGSAGGEEIGWRGFALPHLQSARSALTASLALGVVWGVWHLPLYLIGADIRPIGLFAPWVVLTVAMSVILTWVYNGTGGSLLLVVVFHAAANVPLTVFYEPLDDNVTQPFLIYVALMVVAAAVVVVATGPAALSRTRRQTGRRALAAERRHRQAEVLELLPVVLGLLAMARPDDRLAGAVNLVRKLEPAVERHAGDGARERERDAVERVVVVVQDDDFPGVARPAPVRRPDALAGWCLGGRRH